jgi:hypothetical protein
MADSDVIRRGTDPNGRGLYATRFMWRWWDAVCDELGFTPTIVQGAYMSKNGGGAAASAGYHDGGGCFDLRTWDRTAAEVDAIIRVTRAAGAGSWVRDKRHGMDPHIHFVIGDDFGLSSGAAYQWREYVAGRNGLASRGADYHPRPSPLVTDAGGWLRAREVAKREARRKAARRAKGRRIADDLTPAIRKARRGKHTFPRVAVRLANLRRRLRGRS